MAVSAGYLQASQETSIDSKQSFDTTTTNTVLDNSENNSPVMMIVAFFVLAAICAFIYGCIKRKKISIYFDRGMPDTDHNASAERAFERARSNRNARSASVESISSFEASIISRIAERQNQSPRVYHPPRSQNRSNLTPTAPIFLLPVYHSPPTDLPPSYEDALQDNVLSSVDNWIPPKDDFVNVEEDNCAVPPPSYLNSTVYHPGYR